MCKCNMDPASIVEDTEQIRFCRHAGGQTDGQDETPPPPPFSIVEVVGITSTKMVDRDPYNKYGLTLIPAWISNHLPGKVWDDIEV